MSQFPPNHPQSGGWPPTPPESGWHTDPTGRHQHRYWDGVQWTDHVADGGTESVDPFAGGMPQGAPTQSYDSMGGAPGGDPYGGGPYGGGTPPPMGGPRPKSGPSPALLVVLGVLLIAVIAGVAYVLTQGDDDDDETTSSTTTSTTAEGDSTTTTTAGDTSDSALTEALAAGVLQSANGAITEEQATCVAESMIEVLGTERIFEISQDPSGNAFNALTPEEQGEVTSGMLECVDAETLAEIGASGG
jgi:hypothetical protein